MSFLFSFFDINNTFFIIIGYPMSYLEFFGTLLNILCVWLVARKNIWSWPVGIVAVILFGFLFYQIQLYSDLLEQAYYLVTGIYGWYAWKTVSRRKRSGNQLVVARLSSTQCISGVTVIIVGTVFLGWMMSNIDMWLPAWFPERASFPYLDAFTTVMSFVAQWLLVLRRFESWYLWIAVDVIAVWLYWQKEVIFVSLLYAIFLVLAMRGLLEWRRTWHEQNKEPADQKRKEGDVL